MDIFLLFLYHLIFLRSLGASVLEGVDAFHIKDHFPHASLLIWAAPHGNVAAFSGVNGWEDYDESTTNDRYNLKAFHSLCQQLPGTHTS